MSSPIQRHGRLVASLLFLVPVALVMAGCPSSTSPANASANACAGAPRAMAFTHATFRVPGELRKLDEQGCLTSIPNEGHPFAIAEKAIEGVAKASLPPASDDDLPPAGAVPGPPPLDWNYPTPSPAAPVTGTPALWIANFPSSDNTNDRLFYGTSTTRGPNFYALNSLYSTAPSILWSATNGGMDGGAVVINSDGTKVFALDTLGSLNCYAGATGATCAGWSARAYVTGNGASLSAPWVDYATSALYFGDLAGYLYKLNANTGALVWKVNLNGFMSAPCVSGCSPFGLRGSPIFADGMVYVGNDAGVMFRVRDPGVTTPTSAQIDSTWLCASPTSPLGCGAAWSVVNGATIDTAVSGGASAFVYAAANGVMFEFPHSAASSWARTFQVDLGTAAGYPVYSSPIVDYNNLYVYVGYYNRRHKIKYPFSASSVATSGAMAGSGPDGSYPHSSPMPYSDAIFIGDGAGSSERFGCAKTNTAPVRTAQTIVYGSSVDSVPVIDFGTGNINFGYTATGGTSGGVVRIARTASWGCSPGNRARPRPAPRTRRRVAASTSRSAAPAPTAAPPRRTAR